MKYVYRKQLYTDLQHSLLLVAGLIIVGFAARKSTSICASSPKFFDDTNNRGVGGQQADVQMKVLEDCIIFLRPAISKLSSSSSACDNVGCSTDNCYCWCSNFNDLVSELSRFIDVLCYSTFKPEH